MKLLAHCIKSDKKTLETTIDFLEEFNREEFKIFVTKSLYQSLIDSNFPIKSYYVDIDDDEIKNLDIDLILSFGGDGTVLTTVDIVKEKNVPVLGINTGSLGFLTKVSKDTEHKKVVNLIKNNNYFISNRNILEVTYENSSMYALNEVSVTRRVAELMEISTYVDDKYLTTYRADGLILSTSTGSTGYSLSCGGPIIVPEVNNLILTPIAPHNLNFRPIILPDTSIVKCVLRYKRYPENKFRLSADSKIDYISNDSKFVVKKADFNFNMIEFSHDSFFQAIREKLLWGEDYRD